MKVKTLLMVMYAAIILLFAGCDKENLSEDAYYVMYELRYNTYINNSSSYNTMGPIPVDYITSQGTNSSYAYAGETFNVIVGPFSKGKQVMISCPEETSLSSNYYGRYTAIYLKENDEEFVCVASSTDLLHCSYKI